MNRTSGYEGSAWTVLALVLIASGAFVLLSAAAEEPYHIDELRQTRHYDKSLARVVEESRLQEQPPLDPLLNSIAQRALGVGDIRQRLLSVAFAVGSLVIVWRLSLRAGLSPPGAATAVGVMAMTPALIDVSAYARPYALPLFLMLAFLILSDIWLKSERTWALAGLGVMALALPWSRTVEPLIFLVLALLAAGVIALRNRQVRRRAILLGVVGALGLVSGFFALSFVFDEIADRTSTGASSLSERIGRLFNEVPATFAQAFPFWAYVAALGLLLVALPRARRLLGSIWWWWVLLGTGVGFAAAFSLVAPIGQSFYARYLFVLAPSGAILVGVAVSSIDVRSIRGWRMPGISTLTLALALLTAGTGVHAVWLDLTRPSRADWREASLVVSEDLPDDTVVIYDAVTSLGSYRTPFAGYPRYTADAPRPPLTLHMIENPSSVPEGANTAVLLLTARDIDVEGWTAISVDRYFTVYIPDTPYVGKAGVARAAEEFGEALGPNLGSAMSLAAASIWLDIGNRDRAAGLLAQLRQEADMDAIQAATEFTDLKELMSATES